MKRFIIPLVIGLVVILIGGMGYLGFRSTQVQADLSTPNIPQTVTVSRGVVEHTVTAPGKLVGIREVTLKADIDGRLDQIKVRPGESVHAGQVLATLEAADLELQAAQAKQTYLKQQAAYSDTVRPEPQARAVAQAAVSSASAAYRAARQHFELRNDQVTAACLGFKNASDALALAQAAYDSVANDWKAKNYQIYTIRKEALDNALSAYELARAQCNLNA